MFLKLLFFSLLAVTLVFASTPGIKGEPLHDVNTFDDLNDFDHHTNELTVHGMGTDSEQFYDYQSGSKPTDDTNANWEDVQRDAAFHDDHALDENAAEMDVTGLSTGQDIVDLIDGVNHDEHEQSNEDDEHDIDGDEYADRFVNENDPSTKVEGMSIDENSDDFDEADDFEDEGDDFEENWHVRYEDEENDVNDIDTVGQFEEDEPEDFLDTKERVTVSGQAFVSTHGEEGDDWDNAVEGDEGVEDLSEEELAELERFAAEYAGDGTEESSQVKREENHDQENHDQVDIYGQAVLQNDENNDVTSRVEPETDDDTIVYEHMFDEHLDLVSAPTTHVDHNIIDEDEISHINEENAGDQVSLDDPIDNEELQAAMREAEDNSPDEEEPTGEDGNSTTNIEGEGTADESESTNGNNTDESDSVDNDGDDLIEEERIAKDELITGQSVLEHDEELNDPFVVDMDDLNNDMFHVGDGMEEIGMTGLSLEDDEDFEEDNVSDGIEDIDLTGLSFEDEYLENENANDDIDDIDIIGLSAESDEDFEDDMAMEDPVET